MFQATAPRLLSSNTRMEMLPGETPAVDSVVSTLSQLRHPAGKGKTPDHLKHSKTKSTQNAVPKF